MTLHSLAQSVAVVVGGVELLQLQPAGSPRGEVIVADLIAAADLLVRRTERLREVLHGMR